MLLDKRKEIGERTNKLLFHILGNDALRALSENPATTVEQFSKIHGVGEVRAKEYGNDFVGVCQMFEMMTSGGGGEFGFDEDTATVDAGNPDGWDAPLINTGGLEATSESRKDMSDRITVFLRATDGGFCNDHSPREKRGGKLIWRECVGNGCKFCVVARKNRGHWKIDWKNTSLAHHSGCCAHGRLTVSMSLATLPAMKSHILSSKNAGKAQKSMHRGELQNHLLTAGFGRSPTHFGA